MIVNEFIALSWRLLTSDSVTRNRLLSNFHMCLDSFGRRPVSLTSRNAYISAAFLPRIDFTKLPDRSFVYHCRLFDEMNHSPVAAACWGIYTSRDDRASCRCSADVNAIRREAPETDFSHYSSSAVCRSLLPSAAYSQCECKFEKRLLQQQQQQRSIRPQVRGAKRLWLVRCIEPQSELFTSDQSIYAADDLERLWAGQSIKLWTQINATQVWPGPDNHTVYNRASVGAGPCWPHSKTESLTGSNWIS